MLWTLHLQGSCVPWHVVAKVCTGHGRGTASGTTDKEHVLCDPGADCLWPSLAISVDICPSLAASRYWVPRYVSSEVSKPFQWATAATSLLPLHIAQVQQYLQHRLGSRGRRARDGKGHVNTDLQLPRRQSPISMCLCGLRHTEKVIFI